MAGRDNWFENAALAAEATDIARKARDRKARLAAHQERLDREAAAREALLRRAVGDPSAAAEALEIFEKVASGALPTSAGVSTSWDSPGYPYPKVGPIGSVRPPRSRANDYSEKIPPRKPTANEGLTAIIDAVRNAGDADAVMKAAGEWITKLTNGITAAVKEADDQ